MYKCVHWLAPLRLCDEIELVCDRHDINTCNSNSLNVAVPKPKVECFRNSVKYSGNKVWYEIPGHIQCATSVKYLTLNIKETLLLTVTDLFDAM